MIAVSSNLQRVVDCGMAYACCHRTTVRIVQFANPVYPNHVVYGAGTPEEKRSCSKVLMTIRRKKCAT